MRFSLLTAILLISWGSTAEDLNGRGIVVEGSGWHRPVPVSVPYAGGDPEKTLVVRHAETGVEARAIVASGTLSFLASSPGNHTVRVLRSKRKPQVAIEKRRDEDALEVRVRGELLTVFHYGEELRKPYLWPLTAEGGVHITRDFPMGEPDKSKDHPHHTSFWTAHGDVNGADYWEHGERTGWQQVEDIEWSSGDGYGSIRVKMVWVDREKKPVLSEERVLTFYDTPANARLFDVTVALTADRGAVTFGDTKEGGIVGLRIADAIRERGGTGTITNSAGGVGAKETWGKPAAWCDYSGTFEGVGARGVTVMDHPENLRHPTHWHVRDYGLMGANPFGYSYFYDGEKNGEYELEADATLTFQYRIYIHSGDVKTADVAEVYRGFESPPTARWAD